MGSKVVFGSDGQWRASGRISWFEYHEMSPVVAKREARIRRQLKALGEIARSHGSGVGMRDREILVLARRSVSQIKAHMKRLAAMVQKRIAWEPKPNGHIKAEWFWLQNSAEYEGWYELYGAKEPVFGPDPTEAHLTSSRSRRQLLQLRARRGHDGEFSTRRPYRSWKSRRRFKWHVLADFTVGPT